MSEHSARRTLDHSKPRRVLSSSSIVVLRGEVEELFEVWGDGSRRAAGADFSRACGLGLREVVAVGVEQQGPGNERELAIGDDDDRLLGHEILVHGLDKRL